MSRAAWVVCLKEIRENLRDRRAVLSSLLMVPVGMPLFFVFMITVVLPQQLEKADKPLSLPVAGAEHAPNLLAHLRREGVQIEPAPEDVEQAVRERRHDLVLVIPATYPAQWAAGEPARVDLVFDATRREAASSVERARAQLQAYAALNGALRMQARGVSPQVTRPLQIVDRDLSTPAAQGAVLLAMLFYFLMLAMLVGGMYLAIDGTAGERERQSLEPLLIVPAARLDLVLGKLLAVVAFALLALLITLAGFSTLVPAAAAQAPQALDIRFTPLLALQLGLLVAPIALPVAGLQMLVASFSRSFREAQTYIGIVMILPIVPSVALLLFPVKAQLWMMAVPIYGQSLLCDALLRGEGVDLVAALVATVSTLLAGLGLAAANTAFYRRERIAFST
jgi:sodium transport system permease protein